MKKILGLILLTLFVFTQKSYAMEGIEKVCELNEDSFCLFSSSLEERAAKGGGIYLINCSEYKLTISCLFSKKDSDFSTEDSDFSTEDSDFSTEDSDFSTEDLDFSTEEEYKIVLDSKESCFLPYFFRLCISSEDCSFSFLHEDMYMNYDTCYKIKLDINRHFKRNRETGERRLSRLSGICSIFECDNFFNEKTLFARDTYYHWSFN